MLDFSTEIGWTSLPVIQYLQGCFVLTDLMRTILALFIAGFAMEVLSFIIGVFGCWRRSPGLLWTTGTFMMLACKQKTEEEYFQKKNRNMPVFSVICVTSVWKIHLTEWSKIELKTRSNIVWQTACFRTNFLLIKLLLQ